MRGAGFGQLAPVPSCHLFLASCPPCFPGSLFNENEVTYTRNVSDKISDYEEVGHMMLASEVNQKSLMYIIYRPRL